MQNNAQAASNLQYGISVEVHGVWCTTDCYYARKLHNMAFLYTQYVVLSIDVCKHSMDLIGEVNAWHG